MRVGRCLIHQTSIDLQGGTVAHSQARAENAARSSMNGSPVD